MNSVAKNKDGFTMIEIIAVLAIVGILGALTIISAGRIIQGFLFTRINADTTQKGHIALNRLTKEFTNIISVDTATTNATSIDFSSSSYIDGTPGAHNVSLAGTTLVLDNDILTDNVNSFSLAYFDTFDSAKKTTWDDNKKIIEITLSLNSANDNVSTFITRVNPRNISF